MSRVIGKLTAIAVSKAKRRGYYGDGGGLYLQVSPTGAKSWVFRYDADGRRHEVGLGPLHTITLAEAREKARACRQQRLEGVDLVASRKAERIQAKLLAAKTMTFRECAEAYIESHRAGWRNEKHAAQWPSRFEAYVYPVFGEFLVQQIDTGLVLRAIEPIWSRIPETANRVRGRIENILDWARVRGYCDGENPARWKGHLDHLLPPRSSVAKILRGPKGEHHEALPYDELPAFMAELRGRPGISAKALEFAILTATRSGEVLGADWSEISDRVWTVPANRMKSGREHRVPLSDDAMAVLREVWPMSEGQGFVFPGIRQSRLNPWVMIQLLKRTSRPDVTVHGFRSTFRDWAAERTNFPREVAEMALAHAVEDRVEAAYRRGDLFQKRRQLMDAWARFCASPVVGSAKVVPIRSGQR